MIRRLRTKFADEGLVITFTFFRILQKKDFQFGTCQFNIIARNENSIFRENFSLWRFDSGKIFKITPFSRGPRATYCIESTQNGIAESLRLVTDGKKKSRKTHFLAISFTALTLLFAIVKCLELGTPLQNAIKLFSSLARRYETANGKFLYAQNCSPFSLTCDEKKLICRAFCENIPLN